MTHLTSRESPLGLQGLRNKREKQKLGRSQGPEMTMSSSLSCPLSLCALPPPQLQPNARAFVPSRTSDCTGSSPVVLKSCSKSQRGCSQVPRPYPRLLLLPKTLSVKRCSYLVVGHSLRFRYELRTAHLAVTVCK